MRRSRTIATALVLVLILAACSKSDEPSADEVSGTIGPDATAPGGVEPGSTGAPGAGAGAGGAAGGTGAGADGDGSAGAGPAARARVQTPDSALNAYFDALLVDDFEVAYAVSSATAQQMARVRASVHQYNDEQDGVSRHRYVNRSFRVATSDATVATYQGRASLETTVEGPNGDPFTETAVFENPVVKRVNDEWRLTDLSYGGKPLVSFRLGATDQVGPVKHRMAVALAYSNLIGIVVDLTATENHHVFVEDVGLEFDDGIIIESFFGVLAPGRPADVFYVFDRRREAARPVAWRATVTIDRDTDRQVVKELRLEI